jgi:hypothetical protein
MQRSKNLKADLKTYSKTDPETWTDEKTAPVPSRVYKAAPLKIDAEIVERIASARPPRIQMTKEEALSFGRRALEVAITSAVAERDQNRPRSEWEPDWCNIRDTSNAARKSLERALRALNPKAARSLDYVKPLGSIEYSSQLNRRRDAYILWKATMILKKIEKKSKARRADLVAIHPTLDHEKRAFIERLIEGWIFLTKKRPGSSQSSQNPFLKFCEAAWIDWHGRARGTDLSFGHPLKAQLDKMSDDRERLLALRGPSWRR